MLELWEMWSTPLLPLLPGPLWSRAVAPYRVISMRNRTKLCTYAKLNCLKLRRIQNSLQPKTDTRPKQLRPGKGLHWNPNLNSKRNHTKKLTLRSNTPWFNDDRQPYCERFPHARTHNINLNSFRLLRAKVCKVIKEANKIIIIISRW